MSFLTIYTFICEYEKGIQKQERSTCTEKKQKCSENKIKKTQ